MTQKDIIDAYVTIRKKDQSIPDEVLDFMKECAIQKLKHQDISYPLKAYRFKDNPKEHEFFMSFYTEYSSHNSMDLIVFGHAPNSMSPKMFLTPHEENIVLSTIQWLGSPVGQGFLNKLGFFS